MFVLMLSGAYSPLKIRDVATREWGFRTPDGKILGRSTIYRILSNPFYYGAYEYPIGSGIWYRGTHETIITEEEFDTVQYLLGKKGRPRPKRHVFDFMGMTRCGECGGAVTAELKIKKQQNGNTHRYIYYHCTKRANPNCSQGCLEETELKKQVTAEIESLEIPPEFHTFAIKWLKEKNKEQAETVKAVVNAQQKAYNAVVRKIEGLTDMRAGGEISAEEFAEKKEKLLEEKKKLGEQFENNDKKIDQWIETGDQMFTFVELAQEKFKNGSPEVKRGILSTLGSNLVIKDKTVSVDIEKSILPLRRISKDVMKLKKRLEPLNNEDKQAQFEQSCIENPVVLGDLDSTSPLASLPATLGLVTGSRPASCSTPDFASLRALRRSRPMSPHYMLFSHGKRPCSKIIAGGLGLEPRY
jgi:predicted metal-binding protein